MDRTPRVSVVVLSKDEPALLGTLDHLRVQCAAIDAECVVVDASEGRLDNVRLAHPWVEWMDFVGPMGVRVTIPHQRNAGVRRSRGHVIAFCDAGGSPEGGWLASLIEPITEGATSATCGPIFADVPGVMDPANDLPDGAPIEIAITANMAFLRRAFDEVGGFDERYSYGSDTDFGFRLLDAGFTMTCAAHARMRMDWGDAGRSVKRARFYGKGNVLLFMTHPRRARTVIRLWPDTVAYPVWIVGMVVLLPLAYVAAWLPIGWFMLLAVPIVRNRRAPDLGALMRVKIERAISFLAGWAAIPLHRDVTVVMVPENRENPYLEELCTALASNGVVAEQLATGPTASQTVNSILLLPRLAWRRLRGVKVLHLHWTYPFAWRWAARLPLVRRFPRWWFVLLVSSARWLGLRVVYTAHNFLPHTPVFDSDRAARVALFHRTDQVITLSMPAGERLEQEYGIAAGKVTVIPEGAPKLMTDRDSAARSDTPLAVTYGHLEAYKGVELLLDAATTSGSVDVELLGVATDGRHAALLQERLKRLRALGRRADWTSRRFTDDELDDLLARTWMAVFPFREITNSTSLRIAMAHGVPCVLPSLPALGGLPRAAAFWFEPGDSRDLARAIDTVATSTDEELSAVTGAAQSWLAEWDWLRVGRATRGVYERALR